MDQMRGEMSVLSKAVVVHDSILTTDCMSRLVKQKLNTHRVDSRLPKYLSPRDQNGLEPSVRMEPVASGC